MGNVIVRPEQSFFLRPEDDKQQTAPRVHVATCEQAGQFHHRDCAGSIVVRPGIDVPVLDAEMIVVGRDQDRLSTQLRIRPL